MRASGRERLRIEVEQRGRHQLPGEAAMGTLACRAAESSAQCFVHGENPHPSGKFGNVTRAVKKPGYSFNDGVGDPVNSGTERGETDRGRLDDRAAEALSIAGKAKHIASSEPGLGVIRVAVNPNSGYAVFAYPANVGFEVFLVGANEKKI